MGYDASMEGTIYLKNMSQKQKEDIRDILSQEFGNGCSEDSCAPFCDGRCEFYEDSNGLSIEICAFDKYRDDEWEIFFNVLKPYIDYTKNSAVEFIGEDYEMWRLRATPNGMVEDTGHVEYDAGW